VRGRREEARAEPTLLKRPPVSRPRATAHRRAGEARTARGPSRNLPENSRQELAPDPGEVTRRPPRYARVRFH
jgi:hypothetical protein